MPDLVMVWLVIAWIIGAIAAGRATRLKGHGSATGVMYALVLGPLFGILYAAALPDRGVQTVQAPAKETPSVRMRAVGPDPEAWGRAKKEGRLCGSCNAILDVALNSGDRCPECSTRKA